MGGRVKKIIFIFISSIQWAFSIPLVADSTLDVKSCSTIYSDDGGLADYSSNFKGGVIIRPDTAYKELRIVFKSFNLHPSDTLKFYSSIDDLYPKKYTSTSLSDSDTLVSYSKMGDVKIEFMSDEAGESSGFEFEVYCKQADLKISNLDIKYTNGKSYDTLVSRLNNANDGPYYNFIHSLDIDNGSAIFNINWYLSIDSIVDATDSLIFKDDRCEGFVCSPDNYPYYFQGDWSLPSVDSAGSYYIIGVVDGDGQTAESDETNNTLIKKVEVTKIIRDSLHVYGDVNIMTCNDTIYDHNRNGLYSYGLTSTMSISPSDFEKVNRLTFLEFDLEENKDYLIFKGGANDSLTGSKIPNQYVAGLDDYFKLEFLSDESGVREGFAIAIDCVYPFDLRVENLKFSDGLKDRLGNETAYVDFEISNTGYRNARNVGYHLYLSPDSILDPTDTLLSENLKRYASLANDTIIKIRDTLRIGKWSDTLNLIVKVFSQDSLSENNNDDNIALMEYVIYGISPKFYPNEVTSHVLYSGKSVVYGECNPDTIFDLGGTDYLPRQRNSLNVKRGLPTYLTLKWLEFDVKSDDTLFVYSGTDSLSNLIGKFNNDHLPYYIKGESNINQFYFVFETNEVNQGAGFSIEVGCDNQGLIYNLDSTSVKTEIYYPDSVFDVSLYTSYNDSTLSSSVMNEVILSKDTIIDSSDVVLISNLEYPISGYLDREYVYSIALPDSLNAKDYNLILNSYYSRYGYYEKWLLNQVHDDSTNNQIIVPIHIYKDKPTSLKEWERDDYNDETFYDVYSIDGAMIEKGLRPIGLKVLHKGVYIIKGNGVVYRYLKGND